MNQRIQQLAEQAGLELSTVLKDSVTPVKSITIEQRKFAQLIVRECILTIQMGITRDGHNTEKYLRSMKHIKQIKEHFGVEE